MAKKFDNLEQYTSQDDIISIQLFGGRPFIGEREKPLKAKIFHCSNKDNCSLLKHNMCLCLRANDYNYCPYGAVVEVPGCTSRARDYDRFRHFFRSHPAYSQLSYLDQSLLFAVIGDFYFFHTVVFSVDNSLPIYEPGIEFKKFSKYTYILIKKENCTPSFLDVLFSFRVRGGLFCDVKKQDERMASLKAEILNKEPSLLRGCQLNITESFIGKKAYIKTLKPGSILKHGGSEFVLSEDRAKLTCNRVYGYNPFNAKFVRCELDVTDDMIYTITDNSQITTDTVLL